jgi:hypothetical protein
VPTKRTLKSWNALSRSQQNRWKQQYGSQTDAIAAYRAGSPLGLRGHANTPDRPPQALARPYLFPRYVATHESQLNELARRKGQQEHGTGPIGESQDTKDYELDGDYTWEESPGTLDGIAGWRMNIFFADSVYRTIGGHEAARKAAQLYARRSGAPAGVVVIQEESDGFGVWFVKNSGNVLAGNRKGMKKRRPIKEPVKEFLEPFSVPERIEANNSAADRVVAVQRRRIQRTPNKRASNYKKQNKGRSLTPAQQKRIRKKSNKKKK